MSSFITPARTITRTSTVRQGDAQIAVEVTSSLDEGVTAEHCGGHWKMNCATGKHAPT